MALAVRRFAPGSGLDDFLAAGKAVYHGNSHWVAPLELELKDRLTPKKNPFFEHAEAALFVAYRDGQPVGRITAQIDREHLRVHGERTGFFGFFDTVDDPAVSSMLLDHARAWLTERGMERMRGPLSLSINEEVGLLVDGFEHQQTLLNNYAWPYQGALAEAYGLEKTKDVFGWHYHVQQIPARAERAWEAIKAMPEVTLRTVNRRHMSRDVHIILDVFNDAWSDNWGFVPATPAEAKKMASDMRLLIEQELSYIAEIDGIPMGVLVCLPNMVEAIADLDGQLWPTGWLKLLWRLKVKRPKSARLMLLGLRKEVRQHKRFAGLAMAMYVELTKRGSAIGYEWGELGWTLEDNTLVNLAPKGMGAKVAKRYRIYEMPLG